MTPVAPSLLPAQGCPPLALPVTLTPDGVRHTHTDCSAHDFIQLKTKAPHRPRSLACRTRVEKKPHPR